jgi:hypothetical protein
MAATLAGFAGSTAWADPAPVDSGAQETDLAGIKPVDPDATPETVALFQNMYYLAGNQWMYGHQMDMAMGYTGGANAAPRASGVAADAVAFEGTKGQHLDNSATKQTWGEHAAVQGIDIGYLELKGEFGQFGAMSPDQSALRPAKYPASGRGPYYGYDGLNVDGYAWADLVEWIAESYQHGSITTISWHETNPVTFGGYSANLYYPGTWMNHGTIPVNMNQTAAYYVLPGGELHNRYEARMDAIVEFNEDITEANGGTAVPILFRPYHEHSGDWFWWGIDDMERKFQPTTYQQFADLFKMLEDYLMDHGVHNFLYEISPDRSRLGEPSVLFEDLTGNAELKALLDKYIDTKTGWTAAVKTTAHADLTEQYNEAQTLAPTSFHYGEPIALNNSGVPLDLDPTTGAQTTGTAQFRDWIDSGKWKDFLLNKWEQGFPGAEYVDVYGIDNYWESGNLNGHSYHPYRNQQAKIAELFCSSFDYVAEKARADKKLVAMTEGSSAIQEIHDRFASQCNTGAGQYQFGDEDGATYPNLKYVSYALTWQGGQTGTGNANPVTGAYRDEIAMAGEYELYETPLYYHQTGDIDVDLDIPAFAGGLAVGFDSASVSLADAALSPDKAWIVGSGDLPAVEIEDSRPGASVGWDATITAGAQLTGPESVDGKALGLAPEVLSVADNQAVIAGAAVAAWSAGFTAGTEFASSPVGESRGIASVGGELSYKIPATVTPGSYQGVLSITVL